MTAQLPRELLDSLLARFDARRSQAADLIDGLFAQPETAQLDAVVATAHKLAGIAATLGFEDIGAAAMQIDRNAPVLPLDHLSRERLERLRAALAEAVRRPATEGDAR
ncbi:MAG: Hpt domain-containing protein [Novosphingobium sp.]